MTNYIKWNYCPICKELLLPVFSDNNDLEKLYCSSCVFVQVNHAIPKTELFLRVNRLINCPVVLVKYYGHDIFTLPQFDILSYESSENSVRRGAFEQLGLVLGPVAFIDTYNSYDAESLISYYAAPGPSAIDDLMFNPQVISDYTIKEKEDLIKYLDSNQEKAWGKFVDKRYKYFNKALSIIDEIDKL